MNLMTATFNHYSILLILCLSLISCATSGPGHQTNVDARLEPDFKASRIKQQFDFDEMKNIMLNALVEINGDVYYFYWSHLEKNESKFRNHDWSCKRSLTPLVRPLTADELPSSIDQSRKSGFVKCMKGFGYSLVKEHEYAATGMKIHYKIIKDDIGELRVGGSILAESENFDFKKAKDDAIHCKLKADNADVIINQSDSFIDTSGDWETSDSFISIEQYLDYNVSCLNKLGYAASLE